ncbi:ATP-grasp domain-containing protein [Azotosporobacter soli]|uniref:ATP-grasp domain-containing protein n=1 Tax=Azotosporobacter soli TaxID=3055040 RepID=UPI0031FE8DEC
MKKLLVVGAGEFQLPGIMKAKELGYYVIATDGDQNAPGKNIADEFMVIDVKDIYRHLEIAQNYKIEGIVSFAAEVAVETVAYVSQQLKLVGNGYDVAVLSHDKKMYYYKLEQAGVRVPKTVLPSEFLRCENEWPKVVVKPSKGSGSRLVAKLQPNQVQTYIEENVKLLGTEEEFLIQEHIDGKEMTVDCFVYQDNIYILAVSEEKTKAENSVSYELVFPPVWLDEEVNETVSRVTKKIINSLGITYGPVHMEYMLKEDKTLYLIDFSLRGGGFKVFTDIVKLTSGEDIVEKYVRSAMGEQIQLSQPNHYAPVILRFLYSDRKGIIKSLPSKYEGVFLSHMFFYLKKPGECIDVPKTGKDRIAYMICWGDELSCLQAQADHIAGQGKVVLESC